MEHLSRQEFAFIRPSPSKCVLGGVARWTREAMVILEAAGYDTVMIETVGVGQSEVMVRGMVDVFLLLSIAGAGDELQGIKKGIVELADVLAVTKADGDNAPRAAAAAAQLKAVVAYLPRQTAGWTPTIDTVSSTAGTGLDELWANVERFVSTTKESGSWKHRRESQQETWLMNLVGESIAEVVKNHKNRAEWVKKSQGILPTALAAEIVKKLLR